MSKRTQKRAPSKKGIPKKNRSVSQSTPLNLGAFFRNHKSLFIIGGSLFVVLLILAGVFLYILDNYKVSTVYVEGNHHYSNDEIMDIVMEGRFGNNSIYLSSKYRDKSIKGVPFVEKMDITVLDPNTIKIEVYEKALAGYVEYLERYMYFDKDGTVVETAEEKTPGIPLVSGLSFDYVIVGESLPVENKEIFQTILTITQLLNKYGIKIDRIYFGTDESLALFFDDVKVSLGDGSDLDEKIMELQFILPELEGRKGTLRMENYTEETKTVSFEPDKG